LAPVQIAYKYVPTAACQIANASRKSGSGPSLFGFVDLNQGANDSALKKPITAPQKIYFGESSLP
jgi:hypothetical protein